MSTKANHTQKISTQLSALSKKLNVPYVNVLTEFLLERLAVRISQNKIFSDIMVFKGGFVSLKVYNSPRYTVDLDTHLKKGNLEKLKPELISCIELLVDDGVWFHFEKSVDLETQGKYGGTRLIFRSGIGEMLLDVKRAQIVHLDIGHGDPITPGPRMIETPFLLGSGFYSWKVYPIETTVAEKLHALIVKKSANSRSKDIFDISRFLKNCVSEILFTALERTFQYRGDTLPQDIHSVLLEIDLSLLRRGWKSAVGDIHDAPSIEESFGVICEYFKLKF